MSPDTDFAASARWRASLRRSQERRLTAMRRRRRRLRGRTLAIVAAASMTVITGVALAADSGSAPAPASQPAVALSVGSSGPAVKQIPRKLGVSPTGYYRPQTPRAVQPFQRSHRPPADGVAGPATLRALGIRATSASYSNGGTAPSDSGSSPGVPAVLVRIAECESGGNP